MSYSFETWEVWYKINVRYLSETRQIHTCLTPISQLLYFFQKCEHNFLDIYCIVIGIKLLEQLIKLENIKKIELKSTEIDNTDKIFKVKA